MSENGTGLKIIDRRAEKPKPESDSFFSMVERLSIRPDIDVDKLQRIMDMQERILDRNAKQAFNAAMVRTQAKMKTIPRDAKNKQTDSHYSRHETIIKIAAPIYTAEGFSLSFYEGDTQKPDHMRVMCDVMHEEGYTEIRHVDVALDMTGIKGSPNKTMIHGEGSSFSYGRRYLTCMIFNIPTGDDDDGVGSSITYITDKQLSTLRDQMNDLGVDEEKFLKYLKVESLEKLPDKKYKTATVALDAKKKAKEKAEKEKGGKE